MSVCAQSALDYSWLDPCHSAGGVFITAEGLMMYLQPEQALSTPNALKRFLGGQMLFGPAAALVRWVEPAQNLAALQGAAHAVQQRPSRRPRTW